MLNLGLISFATPWVLTALAALPVIWWLLRVTPPTPKRIQFPAIRFLLNIDQDDHTSSHTPWWLLVLRLLISALIILALADPIRNPEEPGIKADILTLVIDDSWAAAPNWSKRQTLVLSRLDEAERDNQPVTLITTASKTQSSDPQSTVSLMTAGEAKGFMQRLAPKPWLSDRNNARGQIDALAQSLNAQGKSTQILWFTDALASDQDSAFTQSLTALGKVTLFVDGVEEQPLGLRPPINQPDGFALDILRAEATQDRSGRVVVLGDRKRVLGTGAFTLEKGQTQTQVTVELPLELRNQARRVDIEGHRSAGAVTLIDDRWRRQFIGLVSSGSSEGSQPLLSELHYLQQALAPYAELRLGSVDSLIQEGASLLVLTDTGKIVGAEKQMIEDWVNKGGVLLRFAGPRMAGQSDDLTPVPLRQGGRALGGALSWSEPQALSPFEETSPFFGLSVPEDVQVTRQVLAEPGIDVDSNTWSRLADGTPLVTSAPYGEGRIVLFHVTASPRWSTLPMSGLFVDMLRRVSNLASRPAIANQAGAPSDVTETATDNVNLRPLQVLDGFGDLRSPDASVDPLPSTAITTQKPGPDHPPGFYGTDQNALALNPVASDFQMTPLDVPGTVAIADLSIAPSENLKPTLLLAALVLILLDGVIALILSGRLSHIQTRPFARTASLVLAVIALSVVSPSSLTQAQEEDDRFAILATEQTPLAYVITGVPAVDKMSEAGLRGLSRALLLRTAMEPAEPMGVDVERDELAFFPLIYWPITEEQEDLSPDALRKIDQFMKNGGTILFDTQDHQTAIPGVTNRQAGNPILTRLLSELDIPPLEPVPTNHVLTKAFYLLQDFPGRWSGGRLWVEAQQTSEDADAQVSNDGVSAIIIGSNDYAAAWAEDGQGRPMAAVVPGGRRQRELSIRFGINLVMYTLTGNYKADQVHIPALLERLGQ